MFLMVSAKYYLTIRSLTVSLICEKLRSHFKEKTFCRNSEVFEYRSDYVIHFISWSSNGNDLQKPFTDEDFFSDFLPNVLTTARSSATMLPPLRVPFICFLITYFENSQTKFSSKAWTDKNRAICSNIYYLIQEQLTLIWKNLE